VRFDPVRGCVPLDIGEVNRVVALAVDDMARLLVGVVANQSGSTGYSIFSHRLDQPNAIPSRFTLLSPRRLTPVFTGEGRSLVGAFDDSELTFLSGDGVPEATVRPPPDLRTGLILAGAIQPRKRIFAILFRGNDIQSLSYRTFGSGSEEADQESSFAFALPWQLSSLDGIDVPPISWSRRDPRDLQIAAVTDTGSLGWANLRLFGDSAGRILNAHQVGEDPQFLAAALLPLPNPTVAGILPDGVRLFVVSEGRMRALPLIPADLSDSVACFFCPPSRELVVVCRRGDVVRLNVPD
jgi:hypothetical protein